ncbi:hypothetical protein [Vulgatibacter sp.]|uniref:hypothetical protein n=1 Tax=Vulgatibacter sp. TaxID=1971226 RepID=UPI00356A0F7A
MLAVAVVSLGSVSVKSSSWQALEQLDEVPRAAQLSPLERHHGEVAGGQRLSLDPTQLVLHRAGALDGELLHHLGARELAACLAQADDAAAPGGRGR